MTVWSTGAVRLQRWDGTGAKVGAEVLIDVPIPQTADTTPSVTVLGSGRMVVSWSESVPIFPGSSTTQVDVHMQLLAADGSKIGGETLVNVGATAGNQIQAEVVALAGGGFLVSWEDVNPGKIRGQLYDALGGAVGQGFFLAPGGGPWLDPQVAALSSGGFVVVWERNFSVGSYSDFRDVHAQLYDSAGRPLGNDIVVKLGIAASLDVAALPDGGFIVTWEDYSKDGTDQDSTSIRARAFDSAGRAVGAEVEVNSSTAGYQIQPVVTALEGGDVAIAWADWTGAPAPVIRVQRLEAAGAVSGTEGGDLLAGSADSDELLGLGGDDELVGGAGGDRLDGGTGQDVLRGGDGDDLLVVRDVSTDYLEGGAGTDTLVLDFSGSGTRVISYGDPLPNESEGGLNGSFYTPDDVRVDYTSIERFEITGDSGDDVIVTGGGDDVLAGMGGNDRLEGHGGSDLFIVSGEGRSTVAGGEGPDSLKIDWRSATAPVTVTLGAVDSREGQAGSVDGGALRRVDFTGIESFDIATGSGNDVVATGSGRGFILLGDGDDLFAAGNSSDYADGGAGFDGLAVDLSFFSASFVWTLAAGPLLTPGGGTYVNFEYLTLLRTGSGSDSIVTAAAALDDTIFLGSGNDSATVVDGHDRVDGGPGVDRLTIDYSAATGPITTAGDSAWLGAATGGSGFRGQLGDGAGRSVEFDNIEAFTISTGAGADRIFGGANADTIRTGGGNDLLDGGAGDDLLDGGAGADELRGGSGNDIFEVDEAGDTVTELAGEGTDTIRTALGTQAAIYALAANVENLVGTSAAGQMVAGNALDNVMTMGAGNDVLDLRSGGNDMVNGGDGNDYIYFGAAFTAADTIVGGAGTDTVALLGNYNLTLGANTLSGVETFNLLSGTAAGGTEHVSYSITTVDANIAAGGRLTVYAGTLLADESLFFNGYAETDGAVSVYGGAGNDTFAGGPANDAFVGGAGDDQMYGLGGMDWLEGGLGADQMRGGLGNDLFVYMSAAESTAAKTDHIFDFEDTQDHISLTNIDANSNVAGDQAFNFIGGNAFSHTAGELRAYQSGSDWFVEGDVDGDGNADLVIQVTTFGGHVMAASDFLL